MKHVRKNHRQEIMETLQHCTRYHLSKLSGVSQTQIGRYVTGKNDLHGDTVYKLLLACDDIDRERMMSGAGREQ